MSTVIQPGPEWPLLTIEADADESLLSIDESTIVSLYKEHGAILFRGFTLDVEAFRDVVTNYCSGSVSNESPDRLLIDEKCNIQTVNIGPYAFPLHPELSREPWKPDVCFFWCMNPPSQGGETLICDGIEIVRNMPPEVFHAFAPRRLLYAQFASPEHCEYWLGTSVPEDGLLQNPPDDCPYSFSRVDGKIIRLFSRPAFHTPMFSTQLAFGNFVLFARYQLGIKSCPVFENREIVPDSLVAAVKSVSDALAVPVPWQRGDLLMLDNTRFMHGRNSIIDTEERRIVAFFGYLKFALPGKDEPPNARWRQPGFRAPHKKADSN